MDKGTELGHWVQRDTSAVKGLNYTALIMIFVCVDEGLQKTWDGGLSARDIFAQSFKEGSINC